MKWFKHDTNAYRDAKLEKMRIKYGMEGYGLYWYCLELIAGSVDRNHINFELEHDAELLSHTTGIHYERIQEMMAYMVNLHLFENANGIITCLKMAKRIDQSMTSDSKFRQAIQSLHQNHDSIMMKSEKNHDSVMTQSCKKIEDRSQKIEARKKPLHVDTSVSTCPMTEIIDLYHQTLPNLPRVAKLTKTRQGYLRQRWREDLQTLQQWKNFFIYVGQSDFLMGRITGNDQRPPFRADLEWLTRPGNFTKVAEGKYHV